VCVFLCVVALSDVVGKTMILGFTLSGKARLQQRLVFGFFCTVENILSDRFQMACHR